MGQPSTEEAFALLTQLLPKILLMEISMDVAEFHGRQSLLSLKWTVQS